MPELGASPLRRQKAGTSKKGAAKGSRRLAGVPGVPADRITFSEKFACPVSGFTIAEIEPRLFSFNAPQGACPACDGLGEKAGISIPQLVVPNEHLSIKKGAVVPWAKSNPPSPYYMQVLASLAQANFGFSLDTRVERACGRACRGDPARHEGPAGDAEASSTGARSYEVSRSRSRG